MNGDRIFVDAVPKNVGDARHDLRLRYEAKLPIHGLDREMNATTWLDDPWRSGHLCYFVAGLSIVRGSLNIFSEGGLHAVGACREARSLIGLHVEKDL